MKRKIILIVIMVIVLGVLFRLLTEEPAGNQGSRQRQPKAAPMVKVKERRLLVDFDRDGKFKPYFIKGVNYRPTPIGRHPNDSGYKDQQFETNNIFDDEKILQRDFELLKKMGCNTIRLWKTNDTYRKRVKKYPNRLTKKTLDLAEKYGIKVIAGFWIDSSPPRCARNKVVYNTPKYAKKSFRNKQKKEFVKLVKKFKDHPAILFWAIGNANDDDIDPLDFNKMQALYALADKLAAAAHKLEGKTYHPVAFVNGDIDTIGNISYDTLDIDLKNIDIWGANVYRGDSFGDLFKDYAEQSEKPLWISEYGVDAWNSDDYRSPGSGKEDQDTQAQWVGRLWDEVVMNQGITIGATVTEYSDEWWRPYRSSGKKRVSHNSTHDYYGIGPKDMNCDGYYDWVPPAPDQFFHLEWFGIMSIEEQFMAPNKMSPRKVYYILQEKFLERSKQ